MSIYTRLLFLGAPCAILAPYMHDMWTVRIRMALYSFFGQGGDRGWPVATRVATGHPPRADSKGRFPVKSTPIPTLMAWARAI